MMINLKDRCEKNKPGEGEDNSLHSAHKWAVKQLKLQTPSWININSHSNIIHAEAKVIERLSWVNKLRLLFFWS